jgi:pimeloyl-ACP methyl ester carboxylesterase
MTTVHHRYATVNGRRLFYREAGPPGAPDVVLLHGFPTSSFMFRHLIPLLAGRYHVIAPDHLGFGLSGAPPASEFDYTFDALAGLTAGLLGQLGVRRYAMYVQDYGAPVGWRLALASPDAVTAIITQNGNGYEAGFGEVRSTLTRPSCSAGSRVCGPDPAPWLAAARRSGPSATAASSSAARASSGRAANREVRTAVSRSVRGNGSAAHRGLAAGSAAITLASSISAMGLPAS